MKYGKWVSDELEKIHESMIEHTRSMLGGLNSKKETRYRSVLENSIEKTGRLLSENSEKPHLELGRYWQQVSNLKIHQFPAVTNYHSKQLKAAPDELRTFYSLLFDSFATRKLLVPEHLKFSKLEKYGLKNNKKLTASKALKHHASMLVAILGKLGASIHWTDLAGRETRNELRKYYDIEELYDENGYEEFINFIENITSRFDADPIVFAHVNNKNNDARWYVYNLHQDVLATYGQLGNVFSIVANLASVALNLDGYDRNNAREDIQAIQKAFTMSAGKKL